MAIVAAGALVLSACTSGETDDNGDDTPTQGDAATEGTGDGDDQTGDATDPPDDGGEDVDAEAYEALDAPAPGSDDYTGKPDLGSVTTASGSIAYSVGADDYQGYNSDTALTNAVSNSVINARISSDFWYYGTDGVPYPDPNFGTYRITVEEPLTVEYTISDNAVWEDGTPITYNDFLVDWASRNPIGLYGEAPEEGSAGPWGNVSTTYGQVVPDGPQGELDGKTFTLEYDVQYPDWRLTVGGAYPAHVIAEQSGMSSEELVEAIENSDVDALEGPAEFWTNGWVFEDRTLPDASMIPSSGPYTLNGGTWQSGEYLSVVANPEYWGPPPATESLIFRFAAPETHVQALANQDLHVIEPQATIDTIGSIEDLGDSVTLSVQDTFTFEHLDYQFSEDSPFAEGNGGLAAREAFALCVPRDTIVANLIQPINEDAVTMDVREQYPFQPGYDDIVAAAYDGRYDTADLDEARAKFEESGLEEGTEIRIGYGAGNARRASTVQIIKNSCDQVGFEIVDAAAEQLGAVLSSGDWEIALFAWAGSGVLTGSKEWWVDGGQSNYGGYSNPVVDEAWATIESSIDPDVHAEQLAIIDREGWETLQSIPLYAHPGVVAYSANIQGLVPTATQTQSVWNAEQWSFE